MERKTVEVEAGFADKPPGERERLFVDIPADTPAERLEAEARNAFERMVSGWNTPYVFQGVRRVPEVAHYPDQDLDQGGW